MIREYTDQQITELIEQSNKVVTKLDTVAPWKHNFTTYVKTKGTWVSQETEYTYPNNEEFSKNLRSINCSCAGDIIFS